jgi:hypothetical protein
MLWITLKAASAAPSSRGLPAHAGGDPEAVDPELPDADAAAGTARLPASSPAGLAPAASSMIRLMAFPVLGCAYDR